MVGFPKRKFLTSNQGLILGRQFPFGNVQNEIKAKKTVCIINSVLLKKNIYAYFLFLYPTNTFLRSKNKPLGLFSIKNIHSTLHSLYFTDACAISVVAFYNFQLHLPVKNRLVGRFTTSSQLDGRVYLRDKKTAIVSKTIMKLP